MNCFEGGVRLLSLPTSGDKPSAIFFSGHSVADGILDGEVS